jgi:hypothetical protein
MNVTTAFHFRQGLNEDLAERSAAWLPRCPATADYRPDRPRAVLIGARRPLPAAAGAVPVGPEGRGRTPSWWQQRGLGRELIRERPDMCDEGLTAGSRRVRLRLEIRQNPTQFNWGAAPGRAGQRACPCRSSAAPPPGPPAALPRISRWISRRRRRRYRALAGRHPTRPTGTCRHGGPARSPTRSGSKSTWARPSPSARW